MDVSVLNIRKDKIEQFNKKGIISIDDLANYFPRKYHDFSKITLIKDVKDKEFCAVVGVVQEIKDGGTYVSVKIKDESNWYMNIMWFNNSYMKKLFKKGDKYIFCGRITISKEYNSRSMVSPLKFSKNIASCLKIMPVYSKIQNMTDDFLLKSIESALSLIDKNDYLELDILKKFKIVRKPIAYKKIHQPTTKEDLIEAKKRFVFDNLFRFNMKLIENQQSLVTTSPFIMKKCIKVREFLSLLPFQLTDGQNSVLKEIFTQMNTGKRLNALVQGDVGAGKTMVAILAMLYACENGFQSVLMCPTTVLAKQHYKEICEKTENLGCRIAFLSGETKEREKKKILKELASGEIDMLVGTHSVISNGVVFKNLALTVVDEEHRFGVVQRNLLKEKAERGVHNITMSATPIPRSLALAVYGDSVTALSINTLPKGRKPIKTVQTTDEKETYDFMYQQIKEGRQCYVVCPLIEDSDAETLEGVDSVETTYAKMTEYFKDKPEIKIGMIASKKNGKKVKQSEITDEIERFSNLETQIIISTTIIEVGVNVPNSTVIMIKNAERFGIAQLHQLRGRVGRGQHQSYCILLSKDKENPKLKIMCETTDGFRIAEEDLKLRGAGDFIGTDQTGSNKYIMLMLAYPKFNAQIKQEVLEIYKNEKRLNMYRFLNSYEL